MNKSCSVALQAFSLVCLSLQRRLSSVEEKIVVAKKNFSPEEETDIALHKDEEYIVIDCSQPNWWTVRDKDG